MNSPKIAIYARVSKEPTAQGDLLQNPANQTQPLILWASALGDSNPRVYVDYVSGGTSNRPEFQEMLKAARQRHINTILVWDLDRFSREGVTVTLSYIKELRAYGVNLRTHRDNIDTTTGGVGDVILSVLAYAAELERLKISDRTKAGLERAKKAGVRLGRPPKKRGGQN